MRAEATGTRLEKYAGETGSLFAVVQREDLAACGRVYVDTSVSVSEYVYFCACVVINTSLFLEGDTRMSCLIIVRAFVYAVCFRSRVLAFGIPLYLRTSLFCLSSYVFICGLMLTPQVP